MDKLYVKDTPKNRELLTSILGDTHSSILETSVIEVIVEELSWRVCFTHEWLYVDEPVEKGIYDVICEIRDKKVRDLLKL